MVCKFNIVYLMRVPCFKFFPSLNDQPYGLVGALETIEYNSKTAHYHSRDTRF